jgi:TctA family transporter
LRRSLVSNRAIDQSIRSINHSEIGNSPQSSNLKSSMFDVFLSSLLQVLAPHTFGVMLVGIAVGLVVGILPGLGGAATLALMLPFVYPMDAISAFAFLLGMHAVTATAGDITSVLFGIPGEATSAATVLDGYPMARRGEAGRALGAVLFSSLIGALVGAIVLALSVPVIRPVVLAFGPPEFLMLTVLGLSFVISLAGRSPMKGFIMAAFGFLVAMVGLDPQSSIQRFTFGQLYLWDGINIVPVVVGLFGGAEILQLMMSKGSIAERREERPIARVMQGVRDTFEHWWLTLRASAIGVGIGVIPGMGGAVSQFIAYAHAQHTSKHPETFGKGNIEGVLAAGAVNNAREGGNLIPTVAFGIPGSVSMAILLSVFLIKGLVPGPAMLTRNLNVTYSMVWIIVLSNIIAVSLCFLFLTQLAKLTHVRGVLLVPSLLVLTAFGAYTAHNSFADLLVMLAATGVGVVGVRWDWPRAPLLLALVLGDIAERNLFLSRSLYEWTWLTRPLVITFAVITLAGLIWPWVRARIVRPVRLPASGADRASPPLAEAFGTGGRTDVAVEGDARSPSTWTTWKQRYAADMVITVASLAMAIGVLVEARGWPLRASLFPIAAGSLLLGLAVLHVLRLVLHRTSAPERQQPGETRRADDPELTDVFQTATREQWLSALGWMAAFFVALWLLGMLITVPLFAMVYLLMASRASPVLAGSYALLSWAFVYGLFDRLLRIPLP